MAGEQDEATHGDVLVALQAMGNEVRWCIDMIHALAQLMRERGETQTELLTQTWARITDMEAKIAKLEANVYPTLHPGTRTKQ